MSRKGLWSCQACAVEHGLPWLDGQASWDRPNGWCGMTQHRVQTRLEWVPDAEPALHVLDYVFPNRSDAAPAASAEPPASVPAPAPAAPSVKPGQMELLL